MPEKTAAVPSARDRHAEMHREIRHRICLLDYPPGLRLSEAELAEEFGTSRSPLRRVLARLEDEGLVRSVHGVGTFVTDADIEALEQAYRLRVELVALSGRLDPVLPDVAFMDALDSLITQSETILVSGTPRSFTQLDIEVFCLLSGLTSNAPLRQIQARLYYGTKRIWLKTAIAARLDLDTEYRIFHQELLDIRLALRVKDLESVAHIQRAHISMSFKRLVQSRHLIGDDATP